MIYTVTLNPALDYVMELKDFAEGKLNRAACTAIQPGGKGINVSCILHQLGVPTCAICLAAGFTGEKLQQNLADQNINTDFIFLPEGMTRINVKLKTQKDEGSRTETEINAAGPTVTEQAKETLLSRLDQLIQGDILVLSGSVAKGFSPGIYKEMLERVQERGISAAVDAQGELLLQSLRYHPFLIKPNLAELQELWGRKIQTKEDLQQAARSLREKGAENILVSLGAQGAVLFAKDGKIYRCPAPKGKLINSVGAGDSMLAGFLAEYLKTKDFSLALDMGIAAGSATAFSEGLADREKIMELFCGDKRNV